MNTKLVSSTPVSSLVPSCNRDHLVIPYSSLFPGSDSNSRHLILHAKVTGLTSSHINIDRTFPELGLDSTSIPYDYSVYALGSHLPAPIDIWTPHPNVHDAKVEEQPEVIVPYSGSKSGAIGWMQDMQKRVEGQRSVLVVGGGALGIRTYYSVLGISFSHLRLL